MMLKTTAEEGHDNGVVSRTQVKKRNLDARN